MNTENEDNLLLASGYIMIREAMEDTSLQIPKPLGEEGVTTVPVPKGTQVHKHNANL